MKKFIAPEVKVVRYDSGILCVSVGMGDDWTGGDDADFDAPQRRRSIFEDNSAELEKSSKGLK